MSSFYSVVAASVSTAAAGALVIGSCRAVALACSNMHQTAFKVAFAIGSTISLLCAFAFYWGAAHHPNGNGGLVICFIIPVGISTCSFLIGGPLLLLKSIFSATMSSLLGRSIVVLGGLGIGCIGGGIGAFGMAFAGIGFHDWQKRSKG